MSNAALYLRYLIVCVITMAVVMVITILLATFTSLNLGSASGVITAVLPALEAGQTYARRTGQPLEKGRMWRLSAVFTLINTGLGIAIFVGLAILEGGNFLASIANIGPLTLVIILLVVFGVYVLLTRFFLGLGARSELKRQETSKT